MKKLGKVSSHLRMFDLMAPETGTGSIYMDCRFALEYCGLEHIRSVLLLLRLPS